MELKLKYVLFFLMLPYCAIAQFEFPPLSPSGSIAQVVGNTQIDIEYERPSVRGRKIYGELVPWNKVWRTGAGNCTKISFDKPIRIGNQPLAAGKYSVLSIPNEKEWVIIINSDTTLYGSRDYDYKKDVARFRVNPKRTERLYETLTFDIELIENNAKMYISWENVQVSFDVQTSTDQEAMNYINTELMTGTSKDVDAYGSGASYLLMSNKSFVDALELAEMMIKLGGNEGWGRNIKMNVFEKLHLYEEALLEAEKVLEIAKSTNYEKEENRLREIQDWKNIINRIRAKLEIE